MSLRLPQARPVVLMALVVFVQTTTGCLSNEYRIPPAELQRLAALPPETRGQSVRVLQGVGSRRGDELEPTAAELTPAQPGYADDGAGANVQIHVDGSIDLPPRPRRMGDGTGGWRPPPGSGGGTTGAGGWRGGSGPGLRGTPAAAAGSGWRGSPPASGGGGTGVGRFSGGGGGGGGGGGINDASAALVVLAVVVVALAAVGAVFLVFSEGVRFDGHAQMHPEQPLYLKTDGGERIVTLGTLTATDAAIASEATVKDDEWPGLLPLAAVPLHRKGLAFKLELGTSAFNVGPYEVNGMASHIQLGAFPTSRFGVLLDATFSGAGVQDVITGDVGQLSGDYLVRHSVALELQAFPLALHRFHLGAFAKGGVAITGEMGSGPLAGGGALLEIEITSRLALTFRGGLDAARLDSGWSRAGILTAGVAVY